MVLPPPQQCQGEVEQTATQSLRGTTAPPELDLALCPVRLAKDMSLMFWVPSVWFFTMTARDANIAPPSPSALSFCQF